MSSEQGTTRHAVSVAVPVYNVERYLAQCLDSIQSSLGRRLQLIIVDDGSTDASRAIAERYAERAGADPSLPDVEIVAKPNGGYGSAVNAALDRADGTYVGIMEPDDYLDGDLFGELYAIAVETDLPDVVKSTYKRVWMPDTPDQRIWGSLLRHRGVRTWERGCTTLGESPELVRWHPSVWSAIYRRDFLRETNTRFIEALAPANINPLRHARCVSKYAYSLHRRRVVLLPRGPSGLEQRHQGPHAVPHPLAADGRRGGREPLVRRRGRARLAREHRVSLRIPPMGRV